MGITPFDLGYQYPGHTKIAGFLLKYNYISIISSTLCMVSEGLFLRNSEVHIKIIKMKMIIKLHAH